MRGERIVRVLVLALSMWGHYANAQTTGAAPDTLRPAGADSIRVGSSVLTTEPSGIDTAGAKPLSAKQEALRRTIIPRKATLRSIMLPGLGQAYNRDFWKIPLIYAGIGTSIYFLVDNNREYLKFENAYRVAYNDTTNGPGQGTALVYIRSRNSEQRLGVAQLKSATSTYQRYRDMNVIITVALWALNAIEANVAAHLKTFDLSDDLSLRIRPNLRSVSGTTVPGVRLTLNFKK
ncbi:DUF5683 domain-containing protein [Rudanella lutea]|uniref:DUF5683 domain-containing protein n=1 Tax=Rudanella lutea TaxID=451374 RepID=UPI0012F7DE07|nr:DUF5683 domain-containing protein [Rudanella lutea]